MALEHYKTQVLLLHSEQSTLDKLSTGFNERYSVHLATSGTEALNVFTETPVHVIVSAQDLPGMSGLDALREAKKRSPDTIGILLAGTDQDDGLEALVGDKEVFQIVRGEVTPDGLRQLIDSATQRARILALSESANDNAANVDHPVTEHIVMETSENGSAIISDGTGQMPALQPNKISIATDSGSRNVDILVLTKDDEFLATIKDSSRGLHNVHHAVTPSQAEDVVKGHKVGVLVTDAAMVGSNIEVLTQRLRQSVPRLVAVVAGRRDDGELLMDLINRGHVYRFLLKPVSPGRARLAIEASIKHHLEAAEKAFKPVPQKTKSAAPKPQPKPRARRAAKASMPAPMTASREDSLVDDGLEGAFDEGNSFTETMTGIAISVGQKIADVTETVTSRSKPEKAPKKKAPEIPSPPVANDPAAVITEISPAGFMQNPKLMGIAAVAVVVISSLAWFVLSGDDAAPDASASDSAAVPTVVDGGTRPVPTPSPVTQTVAPENYLESARSARDAGQLISPPVENAVELYVAALDAAPGDPVITAELDTIIEQVFAVAESAILNLELVEASTALQLLHFASPDNPRLSFLSAQLAQLQLRDTLAQARVAIDDGRIEDAVTLIDNARILAGPNADDVNALAGELDALRSNQQVGDVLAKGDARLARNQLIAPANDNARFYYQLALGTDPDNAAARQGLAVVASKLIIQANVAIDIGQLTNAEDLLRNSRALNPSSGELAASTLALQNAKADKLQAAADAQARSERLAEQERVAEQERNTEQERFAEQERIAEQERVAEQERIAEEQRQAEEKRRAAAAATVAAAAASTPEGNVDTGSGGAAGSTTLALNSSSTSSPVAEASTQSAAPSGSADPSAGASAEIEMVPVSSLTRVNYVAPKYPRSARRRNVTGSVDIGFTIMGNGVVSDIIIINSTPGTVFNQAAIDAVTQWRFEPSLENGEPVKKKTAIRLAFNLK